MPIFFAKNHETSFISPEFPYQHIRLCNEDSISVSARPESTLKDCILECMILMANENKNVWLTHASITYRFTPDQIYYLVATHCEVK